MGPIQAVTTGPNQAHNQAVSTCGDKVNLLTGIFGANEAAAALGRIARQESMAAQRSLAEEIDEIFAPWFASVAEHPGLVRDYVVSVMDHPTGPERGAQDQEVVDALARRVLVHRPQMEVRQAYALARRGLVHSPRWRYGRPTRWPIWSSAATAPRCSPC